MYPVGILSSIIQYFGAKRQATAWIKPPDQRHKNEGINRALAAIAGLALGLRLAVVPAIGSKECRGGR